MHVGREEKMGWWVAVGCCETGGEGEGSGGGGHGGSSRTDRGRGQQVERDGYTRPGRLRDGGWCLTDKLWPAAVGDQ